MEDSRFEITAPVTMGLVCFRLKGSNHDNEVLNKLVNDEGKIHITPSKVSSWLCENPKIKFSNIFSFSQVSDVYFLRVAVCSKYTESADMELTYNVISRLASKVLEEKTGEVATKTAAEKD